MSLSYNYPPQMAYPSAPPVYRAFPAPPRLHWAWVLVLSIVTVGIFWPIWLVVQARWVKRATGNIRPFAWTMAYMLFHCLVVMVAIAGSVYLAITGQHGIYADFAERLQILQRVVNFLLYIASVYILKSALESQPIRIPLHGFTTFLFGPVYFQAYLCNYSVEGKVGEQLSGFGASAEAADAASVKAATEALPPT
jgi:hypothetical protein